MNVNIIRPVGFLAVALVLPLAACGEKQAADPAEQNTETMQSPTMEGDGPETPRTGDDGVAVSLPGLPVGRGDNDDFEVRQCVVLSWLGSEPVPDGVSVAVTGVHFDPSGVFEMDGSSCRGYPACAEPFVFTSANEKCSVPVRALGIAESTDLLLSGSALCASQEARKCRDVAAGNSGERITVNQPTENPSEETSEEESPAPEPTETSATG